VPEESWPPLDAALRDFEISGKKTKCSGQLFALAMVKKKDFRVFVELGDGPVSIEPQKNTFTTRSLQIRRFSERRQHNALRFC
jgi:hypothetical protein